MLEKAQTMTRKRRLLSCDTMFCRMNLEMRKAHSL
jgi:hypothetical protein